MGVLGLFGASCFLGLLFVPLTENGVEKVFKLGDMKHKGSYEFYLLEA